ncbi:hypothetical protein [Pseudoalteromonas sp. A25]|uniref:hypothetical protein n=1 Tax=Pseudoalteromonas sp. A25 TaxID=116092 RepID=UPI001260D8BE|nr:hypothetical protein [Pseudoalteromonas sp. A25]
MYIIIFRYAMYSLIALEVMVVPKILPGSDYSELEYYKFIIFMFPFLLVGAHSGYMYFRFTEKEDRFNTLVIFGALQLGLFALAFGLMTQNIFYAIAGLFMGMMVVIEQRVQVEKLFTLALAGKPLISVFLVLVAYLSWGGFSPQLDPSQILSFSVILGFLAWTAIVVYFIKHTTSFQEGFEFSKYIDLIKKGFSINVATILLMMTFFLDRYITKQYYPESLASYSFSYNIIQFVILALTTIGYVNTVKVGEKFDELSFSVLINKLVYTYKVFVVILALFFVFLYVIKFFYTFEGFLTLSVIMSIFFGNFFCVNSVASIALYKGFQNKAAFFLACIFAVNVLLSYLLAESNVAHYWLVLKTGLLLNIYSVTFLIMAKNRLK